MPLPPRAVSLEGHVLDVYDTAFLPDGNRVITVCGDGKARVFYADTGRLIYAFAEHKDPIEALAVLDADLVATGDTGGVICVWDARAKCCLYRADHGPGPSRGLWSAVSSLAASSPSRFVAGLVDGTLLFFQHCGGEEVTVHHTLPSAHSRAIISIAAHGQRMVTGSWDWTARVWDVESRELLATLGGHARWVDGVSMSARYIVTAAGIDVHVWDPTTFVLLRKFGDRQQQDDIIYTIILGGTHALTASFDKTIVVSDLATGAIEDRVVLDFEVCGVTATGDGRIAACGSDESAIVFPAPQKTARIMRAPAAAAAMRILGWRGSRSGKSFYGNSAEVRGWRAVANLPPGL